MLLGEVLKPIVAAIERRDAAWFANQHYLGERDRIGTLAQALADGRIDEDQLQAQDVAAVTARTRARRGAQA